MSAIYKVTIESLPPLPCRRCSSQVAPHMSRHAVHPEGVYPPSSSLDDCRTCERWLHVDVAMAEQGAVTTLNLKDPDAPGFGPRGMTVDIDD